MKRDRINLRRTLRREPSLGQGLGGQVVHLEGAVEDVLTEVIRLRKLVDPDAD